MGATSDNFQSWWSFTANEIYWNYKFKPMVRAVVKHQKQYLQVDYDRISLVRPIDKAESQSVSVQKHRFRRNKAKKKTKATESAKAKVSAKAKESTKAKKTEKQFIE